MVPFALRYLGTERFGLWATISAVTAMLGFADLGVGNGLVNALSKAHGLDDEASATAYVSTAFFSLLGLSLGFGGLFWLAYPHVAWGGLLNVNSSLAASEAGPAVAVFVACFLASMPLGVAQRVHMAYQEGFLANLWLALGALVGFGGALLALNLGGGLPWFVFAFAGGPVVAYTVNSLVLFGLQRRWLRPRLREVTAQARKKILGAGFLFLILGLAAAVGYQSDAIVIARLLGAKKVAQYAVPMKLFFLTPTVLGFMLVSLWPAYGEAIARGDIAWVKRAFVRSVKLSFLFNALPTTFLVIWGREIIHLWAGPQINPPFSLMIALGGWAILTSLLGPLAMLFNGANVIGFQVVWASVMATANIGLSILLTRTLGVAGAVYGTLISSVFFLVIPYCFRTKKLFADAEAIGAHTDDQIPRNMAHEAQRPEIWRPLGGSSPWAGDGRVKKNSGEQP